MLSGAKHARQTGTNLCDGHVPLLTDGQGFDGLLGSQQKVHTLGCVATLKKVISCKATSDCSGHKCLCNVKASKRMSVAAVLTETEVVNNVARLICAFVIAHCKHCQTNNAAKEC